MIKLLNLLNEVKSKTSLKINNEYVVGEVKQVQPQIFAVAIKDDYQRTMLFCRYVEFYASPYDEIRNKFFTWEKYMEIYKDESGEDKFTYPRDWDGFGLPSNEIKKGISTFSKDKGPYDEIMSDIYSYCNETSDKPNWYLIGTDTYSSKTLDHEIAHALYTVNSTYKKNCDKLISNIDKKDYDTVKKKIIDMGYLDEKETIDDEIQACMSTGLFNGLDTKALKKYESDFVNNFKQFRKPY
jgi:hypothetical protein